MAHVKIRVGKAGASADASVLVDGVEMVGSIAADGSFSIDFGDPAAGISPTVTMTILANDGLDVDLPEAVIESAVVR